MRTSASLFTVAAVVLTTSATAETLLFDFGHTTRQTNPGWNNVVPATTTLFATFDSDNNLTPVGLEITDTFFQIGEPSQLGSEAPTGAAADYPVDATDDYFFGHVGSFAGADDNPYGEVQLFNLDPNSTYDFTFFGSRTGVNDDREAIYTVTGANTLSGTLNASNNNAEVLTLAGITPDANNEITIGVGVGPNNNNSNGFYYINVMQVDRVIPEPASLSLLALGATALLRRTR